MSPRLSHGKQRGAEMTEQKWNMNQDVQTIVDGAIEALINEKIEKINVLLDQLVAANVDALNATAEITDLLKKNFSLQDQNKFLREEIVRVKDQLNRYEKYGR